MARRYSSDGDSKQGLTIALVLMVLVSILLGLMAYFGYADARDMVKEQKSLQDRNKALQTQLDEAKLSNAMYLLVSGVGNPNDEKKQLDVLGGLKDKVKNEKGERVYKAELDKINKKGGDWDEFAAGPKTTLAEKVKELQAQLANEQKVGGDKAAALAKVTADFQRELGDMRAAKAKAEEILAGTKNEVEKRIKGIDENYNKVVKEFQDNIIAAEKFAAELAKINKDKQELEAKLAAAIKDAELKVKKLESQLPQIDLLAYDKPKGRITSVNIGTQTAYINLGSADLVKPGLTFSIFGIGTYRPNAERKGSIEVISIVGDHLSSARITETRSSTRDPLLTGDELFNPSWSPGLKQHVAIAGLIDLTGDGRDGTLEFVRNLEKQGVAVDAYLDTRDVAVKGKGITIATNWLLLGEVLEFKQDEKIRENDPRQERKLNINAEIAKMTDEAKRFGVTIVPARRYMAIMGYKLPRTPATIDDWNTYMIKRPVMEAAGKGGEMPNKDMKKGDDMKKDEGKKDDKK